MSHGYRLIQWTPFKKSYDLTLAGAVLAYLVLFIAVGRLVFRGDHSPSLPILLIRALGTAAFVLLHVVLSVGPAARLDGRFLPLLYNRRHMGVTTFALAAAHAGLSTMYYHGFGVLDPLRSLFESNTQYTSLTAFPFEALGILALTILFLMALTSHDLWLHLFTPGIWKSLHILVYAAYLLILAHVALGALQAVPSPVYPAFLIVGLAWLTTLHLLAARRSRSNRSAQSQWLDAGPASDIPDSRAVVVTPPTGQSIAIFRHADRLSAISNVCAHQLGPLGEGRIVDGCVTCPWHGYQYRAYDGCAPPPFTEKLPTYRLRVVRGRVQVDPTPLPPGTPVPPVLI
jgi:methionine sulfoxide reductase heme-binding subunit